LKDAELQLGDYAEVRFRVIDQNSVTVPTELKEAIYADSKLASAWEALSAGKKRGYCHRVLSAKREPTKQRRIDEVLVALRELML
ncbi:MAG: YdeI/OmpD-associated family protein, partial [Calditrichota bacterium]